MCSKLDVRSGAIDMYFGMTPGYTSSEQSHHEGSGVPKGVQVSRLVVNESKRKTRS